MHWECSRFGQFATETVAGAVGEVGLGWARAGEANALASSARPARGILAGMEDGKMTQAFVLFLIAEVMVLIVALALVK